MKSRKFIIAMTTCLALLLVFALILVACDKGGGTDPSEAYYLSLKSTGFKTYTSAKEVPAGALLSENNGTYEITVLLTADEEFTVNRTGSSEKLGYSAIFSSSDALIEGANGNIKAAKSGSYKITVSGDLVSYAYTAVVDRVTIVAPASVLELGGEYQFGATEDMSDGTQEGDITWSTSDAQVASVSESGLVRALAVGSATIKATSQKDGNKYAEYSVQVKKGKVAVSSVSIDPDKVTLNEGETVTLSAVILPVDADDKLVIWDTDSENVATVSAEGAVTAVAPGVAHITVRTRDGGKEAECEVTVVKHVDFLEFDNIGSTIQVRLDTTRKIRVIAIPANATDIGFTYDTQSINGGGAEITANDDGTLSVKGTSAGIVRLTVKPNDKNIDEKTIDIYVVTTPVAYIDKTYVEIDRNESVELRAVLDGAEISNVEWTTAFGTTNGGNITVTGNGETASVSGTTFGETVLQATVTDTDKKTYTLYAYIFVRPSYFYVTGIIDSLGFYANGTIGQNKYNSYGTEEEASAAGVLFKRAAGYVTDTSSTKKIYTYYQLQLQLVPSDSFQVIFSGIDAEWNGKFTSSERYMSSTYGIYCQFNTPKYVDTSNADNFKVTDAGIYTVTVLVEQAGCHVFLRMDHLDANSTLLTVDGRDNATYSKGEQGKLKVDVLPDAASGFLTDAKYFKWEVQEGYERYLSFADDAFDIETRTLSFDVINAPNVGKVSFDLYVYAKASANPDSDEFVKGSIRIVILADGIEDVKPTSIAFTKDSYDIDVNTAGGAWTTTVSASVDAAAFNQGVIYSTEDDGISVDPATGVVTGKKFGTWTVKATAVGDPTVCTETQVIVFSSAFFLAGTINSFEYPGQGFTSLQGTVFENYAFERSEENPGIFTLDTTLYAYTKFQIIYLGMDENWNLALRGTSCDLTNSDTDYVKLSDSNINVYIKQLGDYTVTIDLTGHEAKFTVKYKSAAQIEKKEEYHVRVWMLITGYKWNDNDMQANVLATAEGTVNTSNNKVTLTLHWTVDVINKYTGNWDSVRDEVAGYPGICFAVSSDALPGVELTDDLTSDSVAWYNGDTPRGDIEAMGAWRADPESASSVWCTDNGVLNFWYQGTVCLGARLGVEISFDDYGNITCFNFYDWYNGK